jgi:TolA-binding protein
MDRLAQRIDALSRPRDTTPPDLRTLQIKVDELATAIDEVANLPSRFRRLENRLEDLRQGVKTLRSRLAMEEDAERKPMSLPSETSSSASPPLPSTETNVPDAALETGISLFQQRQYAMAYDIFHKLQLTEPSDARVWYFAALARGYITGKWEGEVRRWAEKVRSWSAWARPASPKSKPR